VHQERRERERKLDEGEGKKMEWERERWELGRGGDEEEGGTIKMD
jgi:hypothetical protein